MTNTLKSIKCAPFIRQLITIDMTLFVIGTRTIRKVGYGIDGHERWANLCTTRPVPAWPRDWRRRRLFEVERVRTIFGIVELSLSLFLFWTVGFRVALHMTIQCNIFRALSLMRSKKTNYPLWCSSMAVDSNAGRASVHSTGQTIYLSTTSFLLALISGWVRSDFWLPNKRIVPVTSD